MRLSSTSGSHDLLTGSVTAVQSRDYRCTSAGCTLWMPYLLCAREAFNAGSAWLAVRCFFSFLILSVSTAPLPPPDLPSTLHHVLFLENLHSSEKRLLLSLVRWLAKSRDVTTRTTPKFCAFFWDAVSPQLRILRIVDGLMWDILRLWGVGPVD